MNDREIYSARMINAPVELVYQAFENPEHLKNWWGPEGFTNTIHEFDLKVGGRWILTMHGPEKGHYENASTFTTVVPNQQISWVRQSQPLFAMELAFENLGPKQTQFSFKMIFETVEECEKIRPYATPKNEENFDRLEREVLRMSTSHKE